MEGKREESWPAEPAEPGPRRKQEPAARPRSPKSSRREDPEPAREHPNRRTKGSGQAPHAMTTALAGWGGGGGKAGRAEKSAQEKRPLPAFPACELVGPESAGSGFRKRAYNHGDLQPQHRDPLLAVPGQQGVVPGDQLVGAVGEVRCTLSQNGYGRI